jgi:DNA modification methylase
MQEVIRRNKLNTMNGQEWLLFTKSWFIHKSSAKKTKIIHPACYPDKLAEDFINFFTKPNDWVIDPFAGIGSTLMASKRLNRNSIGIELYSYYVKYAENEISNQFGKGQNYLFNGDSREVITKLNEDWENKIDFCITSPPYWCQLVSNNNKRNKERKQLGLKTEYGEDSKDLGNISDYNQFLIEQENIFSNLDKLMKLGSYIVIITNNCYKDGKLYPLAFDTFRSLSKIWTPKDEKIWCQDDKKLFPFGIFSTYIGNRSHHYCLIFRKEEIK